MMYVTARLGPNVHVQGSLWTNCSAYDKLMDRVSLTYGSPKQHVWTFATHMKFTNLGRYNYITDINLTIKEI